MSAALQIGPRVYRKTGSPELYRVPLGELGELRFVDVPYYSTVEIEDLPGSKDSESQDYSLSISATHGGGAENEAFFIFAHINFWQPGEASDLRAVAKCSDRLRAIRRAFRAVVEAGRFSDGDGDEQRSRFKKAWLCGVIYSAYFTREENPRIADFVAPLVEHFKRLLATRTPLVFLCHTSEDKTFVDELAAFLDQQDLPVWYDKRQIRIGDSIVECINDGLDSASHVVVVLSRASVLRPWVQKEMSVALMRQLRDRSITILPVLRERCALPALLADVKYADCSLDARQGFAQLVDEVFSGYTIAIADHDLHLAPI